MIATTCSVDMTGLEAGIEAARKYSTRTLPQIVNTSLYWVAINARNDTKFVSPERIDKDFGTLVTVAKFKSGKEKSRKRYQNINRSSTREIMTESGDMIPRAVAVVMARARPGSKYNDTTASRWLLSKSPFKGVSRAAGAAAMRGFESRMLGARHSSSKYHLAGWLPEISILYPFSVQKFGVGQARGDHHGKINFKLGNATPAVEGLQCSASIENSVGMVSTTGQKANESLVLYNTTVLQRAVDVEGQRNLQYALDHAGKELEQEVKKFWT